MKIFRKERLPNGRRHIYLCGIKIASYHRKKHLIDSIKHINKKQLDLQIKNFNKIGINKKTRKQKIIVSLTSFPARMKDIHYTIFSLLNQTVKPDEIVLWLGYDKFPNKEKDLPETLLNLCKYGLTIKWCKDIRSYTKLVPSLKEYPKDVIITVDDDIFYPEYLVEKLYDAYKKQPKMIHCLRAHYVGINNTEIIPYKDWDKCVQDKQPSYRNFLTGVGGVLYPPHCLHKDATNDSLFIKLAPTADDVWFWAMAVRNKTKINVVNSDNQLVLVNPERELGISGEFRLGAVNVDNNGNDNQIKETVEYANILKGLVNVS